MNTYLRIACMFWMLVAWLLHESARRAPPETVLPPGVKAVWDLDKAYRESTATRERICINGLWKWQPGDSKAEQVPADNWGYFKVPGCWPGITDYMQEETQTVYAHPAWKGRRLRGITAAWYEREISIPPEWAGRRVAARRAIPELVRSGLCRRQEGRRDSFPRRSSSTSQSACPAEHDIV